MKLTILSLYDYRLHAYNYIIELPYSDLIKVKFYSHEYISSNGILALSGDGLPANN